MLFQSFFFIKKLNILFNFWKSQFVPPCSYYLHGTSEKRPKTDFVRQITLDLPCPSNHIRLATNYVIIKPDPLVEGIHKAKTMGNNSLMPKTNEIKLTVQENEKMMLFHK